MLLFVTEVICPVSFVTELCFLVEYVKRNLIRSLWEIRRPGVLAISRCCLVDDDLIVHVPTCIHVTHLKSRLTAWKQVWFIGSTSLGSITSRCSGNEPALPGGNKDRTRATSAQGLWVGRSKMAATPTRVGTRESGGNRAYH